MFPEQIRHEEALVRAFILPARRARCLAFLRNPKRREDLTRQLYHFNYLDPRFLVSIPPRDRRPTALAELLKKKGAPAKCWVISADQELDGREIDLLEALKTIVGYEIGTILSCLPGKLGYFEDEDGRFILQRSPRANS